MLPATIDEVILQLEQIIADSSRQNDRAGYFAALYYKVTARVKAGIESNEFDDGRRMEQFDVIFANRYLDALTKWKNGEAVPAPWRVALEATQKGRVLVLQHLLLGMNAHINFDLGLAVAGVMDYKDLDAIRSDYYKINTIISSLTFEVMSELGRVSPLLSLMGLHATNPSILVQFSIDNARDGAWLFAEEICAKTGAARNEAVTAREESIGKLADALVHLRGLMKLTTWVIHLFEWRTPRKIISVLHNYRKQYLKV